MRRSRAIGPHQDIGALERPAATLAKYRVAEELGLKLKIRIQKNNATFCKVCAEMADARFSLETVPALPLPGCPQEEFCCARYVAELEQPPANDRGKRRCSVPRTPEKAR